jgi:hypothetical protein
MMGRTKGAKNKLKEYLPYYSKMPSSERIKLIAKIIVERAEADQQSGAMLLKKIDGSKDGRPQSFA